MTKGEFHLTPNGPKICSAQTNESCRYGKDGHYTSLEGAEEFFAGIMGGPIPQSQKTSNLIELSSNVGTAKLMDGDLSDPRARALLSTGKCGELALAIHKRTGGIPYFVHYDDVDEKELAESFAKDPQSIYRYAQHVVIESPTKPGMFLDSFGQQDRESIEEGWEALSIIRGTPEMLNTFADSAEADRLGKFADAAIELDRQNIGYDYVELDEYSDEEDEEL